MNKTTLVFQPQELSVLAFALQKAAESIDAVRLNIAAQLQAANEAPAPSAAADESERGGS